MATTYFNSAVECAPPAEIVNWQQQRLRDSGVIVRASRSALYKERWQAAGIDAESITNRSGLKNLPYINSAGIKQTYQTASIDDIVDVRHARLWSCTSGTTGAGKWVPYSDYDLDLFDQIMMRDFNLRGKKSRPFRVLALTAPAPFISETLTYLGISGQTLRRRQQELIPVGINAIGEVTELARRRRADVLVSFPSVSMRVSEGITERLKTEVARRQRETGSLKLLAARILFSLRKPSVRDVFKLRFGLFSGESIAPYRDAIRKTYGLEPFETYAFTEFPCLNIECTEHDGIHIWSDCCIPEIIPLSELDKEVELPEYQPQAQFLDEAPAGIQGEYVVTTFSPAFPLIRYRTADLIQVVGTGKCGCGRTHPRIRVLRRLDDIINMGLIRFSVHDLDCALKEVGSFGVIARWQLNMDRQGYKPLPKLSVAGSGVTDPTAFQNEVFKRLMGIKILAQGVESGLVCPPQILLRDELVEETTATGKLKRVVYGPGW